MAFILRQKPRPESSHAPQTISIAEDDEYRAGGCLLGGELAFQRLEGDFHIDDRGGAVCLIGFSWPNSLQPGYHRVDVLVPAHQGAIVRVRPLVPARGAATAAGGSA